MGPADRGLQDDRADPTIPGSDPGQVSDDLEPDPRDRQRDPNETGRDERDPRPRAEGELGPGPRSGTEVHAAYDPPAGSGRPTLRDLFATRPDPDPAQATTDPPSTLPDQS